MAVLNTGTEEFVTQMLGFVPGFFSMYCSSVSVWWGTDQYNFAINKCTFKSTVYSVHYTYPGKKISKTICVFRNVNNKYCGGQDVPESDADLQDC
jgi:hypothetical protein